MAAFGTGAGFGFGADVAAGALAAFGAGFGFGAAAAGALAAFAGLGFDGGCGAAGFCFGFGALRGDSSSSPVRSMSGLALKGLALGLTTEGPGSTKRGGGGGTAFFFFFDSTTAGESRSDDDASDTGFGAGLLKSGKGTGATGSAYLNSRKRVATGTFSSA